MFSDFNNFDESRLENYFYEKIVFDDGSGLSDNGNNLKVYPSLLFYIIFGILFLN